jgi:hypothetical protein
MKDYIKEIYTLINTLDRTAEQLAELLIDSKSHLIIMDM